MADESGPDRSLWLLLPRPVRELPADLAAVVALVLAANLAVLVPGLNQTPLRVVFALPLLLFLPGYAFVATLFPERSPAQTTDDDAGTDVNFDGRGISPVERVALSMGFSVAIVAGTALVLNFTPFGIRLFPILFGVTGLTIAMTGVAATRRRALPEAERLQVPYREWIATGRSATLEPESRLDGLLNVAVALSILLAVGAVGFAVAFPPDGEAFTEFYLLTEDEDGELVIDDFPDEMTAGETASVVVGIGNEENQEQAYTVVVQLQDVVVEDNETRVVERTEIDRFDSPTIGDNETWHHKHEISPTTTGDDLRLQYLLYREAPPPSPTEANAYRETNLWFNVSDPSGGM